MTVNGINDATIIIYRLFEEQLRLCGVGVTLPSDDEVYDKACEFVRDIDYPLNQTKIKMRKCFKAGANFISKEVNDKLK